MAEQQAGDQETLSVAVIVVNFNGGMFVLECIESLVQQLTPGIACEVIVVDNASTDGSDREIEGVYPEVRLIRSPTNAGFAGGVNLAIANSDSDLIVLINNDAVAAPGFLTALVAPFRDGEKRLAAVTARILLSGRFVPSLESGAAYVSAAGERWVRVVRDATPGDGVTLLNSTGNQISRSGNGRDRSWLQTTENEIESREVFGFCGGGAALRRSAVEAVGQFDERLFMYYEDTDMSWRLRRAGWTIEYAHDATVWHRHAASSGIHSPFFLRHNVRNRILVTARHAPRGMLFSAIARTVASLAKALRRSLADPNDTDARVQFRATADGLAHALAMLPAYVLNGNALDKKSTVSRQFVRSWVVND